MRTGNGARAARTTAARSATAASLDPRRSLKPESGAGTAGRSRSPRTDAARGKRGRAQQGRGAVSVDHRAHRPAAAEYRDSLVTEPDGFGRLPRVAGPLNAGRSAG